MIARLIDRLALWSLHNGVQLMCQWRGANQGDQRFQQKVIDDWSNRSPLFRRS